MKRDKVLILVLTLYVISLFLPEVIIADLNGHQYPIKGFFIIFFGWLVMFDWSFIWIANPIFLFSLFRFHHERAGIVLFTTTLALCLGLLGFMMQTSTNIGTGHEDLVQLTTGYFVWIGALALLALYSLLGYTGKVNNRIETGSE